MCFDSEGTGYGAVCKYFYELVLIDEAGFAKFFKTDLGEVLSLSQFSKESEVDSLVFLAVEVLEAPLEVPPLPEPAPRPMRVLGRTEPTAGLILLKSIVISV